MGITSVYSLNTFERRWARERHTVAIATVKVRTIDLVGNFQGQ